MDKKIIYGGTVDTPMNPEFVKKYLDESNDVHLLKNVNLGDLDKIDNSGVYAIDNGASGILVQSLCGVVMGDVSNQYIDQIQIQGSSIQKRQKKNDEEWSNWSEIGVGGSSGTGSSVPSVDAGYTKEETQRVISQVIESMVTPTLREKANANLSNVTDETFLDKLNAVLPDGDEVSY